MIPEPVPISSTRFSEKSFAFSFMKGSIIISASKGEKTPGRTTPSLPRWAELKVQGWAFDDGCSAAVAAAPPETAPTRKGIRKIGRDAESLGMGSLRRGEPLALSSQVIGQRERGTVRRRWIA